MTRRLCLLTGASGTFGSAFIRHYAHRYDIIAIHCQREIDFASQDQFFIDPLSPARPITANQFAVRAVRVDLSEADEIERFVRELAEETDTVDLLVNAAATGSFAPLLAAKALDEAEAVFSVNLLAPLRLCVTLAENMWRDSPAENTRENRNIVNVSSTAGLAVYPDRGQSLYAASMAALNHLTYHLASEFWDIGLRVNAVALDVDAKRGSVEKAIEIVADLDASDRTGEVVPVYGPAESPPIGDLGQLR